MAELKALLENRKEHIQYLQDVLVEPVMNEFSGIYKSVLQKPKILQEFQTELGKIPEWNHVMIGDSYDRVRKKSGCKFLPELLRAIFTTSVKCHLMTHGKMDALDTIRFRVPTAEKFIHRLLIACAQHIWKQPYLFYHAVRSIEQQYNRGKVEDIIRAQVETTIRQCLPLEQLVGLIQQDMDEASESATSSETESEEEISSEESSEDEESEDDISDVEIERIVVEDDSEAESEAAGSDSEAESEAAGSDSEAEGNASETEGNASEAEESEHEEQLDNKNEGELHSEVFEEIEKENVATLGGEIHVNVSDKVEEGLRNDVEEVMRDEEVATFQEPVVDTQKEQDIEDVDPDVHNFDELVRALENEPDVIVSDASPQRKSIEIVTSSSEDESDDQTETFTTGDDKKVIPLKGLLINQRKFHRPKMASRTKRAERTERVPDAFY